MPRIIPYTSLADSVFTINCSSQTEDTKFQESVTHCHILCMLQIHYGEGGDHTDIQNLKETPKIQFKLKILISSCIEKRGFLNPGIFRQHYTHSFLSRATNITPQSCDPPYSVEDKTMQNTELEMITRFKEKTNQQWHFC